MDGAPVTIVLQLNMAIGNLTGNIPYGEAINLQFVSNTTTLTLHARAYLTYVNINGTVLVSIPATNGPESVIGGTMYQMFYNGMVVAQQNAVLPKEETANLTVNICTVYGPYWVVSQSFHFTM